MKLCQEGWHRPALSLFAKVSLAFSCTLPKIACFQNFLLTPLDFCGNLSQRCIAIQLSGCHIGNNAADFPCSGVSAHHQQDLTRRKVHSKMLAGNQIQYRQRFDLFAHHQSAVLLFQTSCCLHPAENAIIIRTVQLVSYNVVPQSKRRGSLCRNRTLHKCLKIHSCSTITSRSYR